MTSQDTEVLERNEALRALIGGDSLQPVIDVNGCPFCASPRRTARGLCSSCSDVRGRSDRALSQFEPVCLSTERGPMENLVRQWKNEHRWARPERLQGVVALLAAPFSAYLESHREELALDEPNTVTTFVPTNNELVAAIAVMATSQGWYFPSLKRTGERVGDAKQRGATRTSRISLTSDAWAIEGDIAGRAVVVLDDVYTTGASMHSFAASLMGSGAAEVRGVALIRHITGTVYSEVLARRRATGEVSAWSPDDRRMSRV